MTTWTKLIDGGGSGFERDLLRSAREDVAPGGARARGAERLGLSTTTACPSFEPLAERPWLAARPRQSPGSPRVELTKLGKLAVLGLIGAFAPLSAVPEVDAPRPTPALVEATEQTSGTSPELALPSMGVALGEPIAPPLVEARRPHVVASRPKHRLELNPRPIEPASPAPSQLMAEVKRLDAARSALRKAKPHQTLLLLDEYEKEFARGELALEAAVLRVRALTQSDQPTEAMRLARRWLSRPGIERYRTELERVIDGQEKKGSAPARRDIGSAR